MSSVDAGRIGARRLAVATEEGVGDPVSGAGACRSVGARRSFVRTDGSDGLEHAEIAVRSAAGATHGIERRTGIMGGARAVGRMRPAP